MLISEYKPSKAVKVMALVMAVLLPATVAGFLCIEATHGGFGPMALPEGLFFTAFLAIGASQIMLILSTERVTLEQSWLTISRVSFMGTKARRYEIIPGSVAEVRRIARWRIGSAGSNSPTYAVVVPDVTGKQVAFSMMASRAEQTVAAHRLTDCLKGQMRNAFEEIDS